LLTTEIRAVANPFADAKPKPEKKTSSTFRLSALTLARLDEMAEAEGRDKTWALEESVKFAHDQWTAERAKKSGSKRK